MYRIGLVSQQSSVTEENIYIDSFDSKLFELLRLQPKELMEQAASLDAVIIFSEEDSSSISTVSSLILEIRKKTNALIWVYQSTLDFVSRMIFLQLGADGVVDAACFPDELCLILLNALKRERKNLLVTGNKKGSKIRFSQQSVGFKGRDSALRLDERDIDLTKKEYSVISVLQSNVGEVFTYQEIYETVWKKSYHDQKDRVANVVFHIREKLEKHNLNPDDYLRTVHGVGYMLLELKEQKKGDLLRADAPEMLTVS